MAIWLEYLVTIKFIISFPFRTYSSRLSSSSASFLPGVVKFSWSCVPRSSRSTFASWAKLACSWGRGTACRPTCCVFLRPYCGSWLISISSRSSQEAGGYCGSWQSPWVWSLTCFASVSKAGLDCSTHRSLCFLVPRWSTIRRFCSNNCSARCFYRTICMSTPICLILCWYLHRQELWITTHLPPVRKCRNYSLRDWEHTDIQIVCLRSLNCLSCQSKGEIWSPLSQHTIQAYAFLPSSAIFTADP